MTPLLLVRPAPLLAAAAMLDPASIPLKFRFHGATPLSIVQAYVAHGRSWGLVDPEGGAIACGGLYPMPMPAADGAARFEAWFLCQGASAPRLIEIIRWAQLTFKAVAQDGPVEILARVAEGHAPGERLARAIGFRPGGVEAGQREFIWRSKWAA